MDHDFGLMGETGMPGENPHMHKDDMQIQQKKGPSWDLKQDHPIVRCELQPLHHHATPKYEQEKKLFLLCCVCMKMGDFLFFFFKAGKETLRLN